MIKFLKEYIKNPFNVGAIMPSTRHLAKEMVRNIDFKNAKCIVEYGPGTGVFSKEIINKCPGSTKIILFETNEEFYKDLSNQYKDYKNVIIINDGAEKISEYLNRHKIKNVDYVISGLPFASLPEDKSKIILSSTKKVLSDKGEFRTFQYTLLKKGLFEKNFSDITHTKIYKNIPPAYVLRCKKEEKGGISA